MTAIPVIPECPGAEPAARRDEGAAMSPLPWRLNERNGVIWDAHGGCVCVLGTPEAGLTERERVNGRAIVAAVNAGQRHA